MTIEIAWAIRLGYSTEPPHSESRVRAETVLIHFFAMIPASRPSRSPQSATGVRWPGKAQYVDGDRAGAAGTPAYVVFI